MARIATNNKRFCLIQIFNQPFLLLTDQTHHYHNNISLKGVARKKKSTMEHVRLTMANYKINQERAHSGDYIYVYVCIYTYVYCVTCRWQQMA